MIVLDPGSGVDPFEQIRIQIADQIRAGDLVEGQRLPSIRQLAADLSSAPGTVAKAYAALEAESLIESSRTRGTRVAPGRTHPAAIQRAAKRYVGAVGELDLEQALSAVRTAWSSRHSPSDQAPKTG